MACVAVIQRHLFSSFPPRVQYLRVDSPRPTEEDWSDERLGAFEFASHGVADDFAVKLPRRNGEHIHAVISEKPIPRRQAGESDLSAGCLSAGNTSPRSRRDEKPAAGTSVPAAAQSFANEPGPVSSSLAVAKRVDAAEGPARDANKPLMRKRKARVPSPTGSNASDTFQARGASLREAQRRVESNESPQKFWWREGQFA